MGSYFLPLLDPHQFRLNVGGLCDPLPVRLVGLKQLLSRSGATSRLKEKANIPQLKGRGGEMIQFDCVTIIRNLKNYTNNSILKCVHPQLRGCRNKKKV